MIVLDTDVLSIQQYSPSDQATALDRQISLLPSDQEIATTIISYEEQTAAGLLISPKLAPEITSSVRMHTSWITSPAGNK